MLLGDQLGQLDPTRIFQTDGTKRGRIDFDTGWMQRFPGRFLRS